MAKKRKKKSNSRAARKERNLKIQSADLDVCDTNKQKNKKTPKKVKALVSAKMGSEEISEQEKAAAQVLKAKDSVSPASEVSKPDVKVESPEKSVFPETLEPVSAKNVETEPGVLLGFGAGRLVGAMAACVAFAMFYNVLVVPYAGKTAAPTELSETTATTPIVTEATTEITTETTTETTTRKLAAPVTKVYKPKPTASLKVEVASKKVLLTVPMVSQLPSYPTGCEAASATMLLKYYGYNVGIGTLVSAIPRENLYEETLPDGTVRVYGPSIYQKFVGDPRQTYTSETPGYGAFAPVVTAAMNSVVNSRDGNHIAKNITGSSVTTLFKYLNEGRPVIVWSTAKMKTPEFVNSWYIKTPSGDQYFEYPRGTHVTVLTGYDSSKVYMNDPYFGQLSFSHSDFASKYALLGKQAIIIEECENTTKEEVTTATDTVTKLENTTTENVFGETTDTSGNTGENSTVDKEGTAESIENNTKHTTAKETTAVGSTVL